MQQPYGNYPYYGQPMYPQTPYMGAPGPPGPSNGYPPYYGPPMPAPAPQNPNLPAPSPYGFDVDAYALKHDATTTAQARRHRRTSTNAAAPLKSAMKKTMTAFTSAENTIGRQFSNPFNQHPHQQNQQQQQQQNQAPPYPRPRVQSNPSRPREGPHADPAFHMLLSFHNYNELHVEHIMPMGLEAMRKHVWTCWKDGVESEVVSGHSCVVKFRNTPWDLNGPNVINTYELIVAIFTVFQEGGYSFQTAVNIATPTPRLVFQVTEPAKALFFIAFFSSDGRKFTMYKPPNEVDISVRAHLRSALPFNHVSDNVVEDDTRVLEIRRKLSQGPDIEASVIFIEILKILSNLNFQLDATLPLGRKNALGIRYTRELLVFKWISRDPPDNRKDFTRFMP